MRGASLLAFQSLILLFWLIRVDYIHWFEVDKLESVRRCTTINTNSNTGTNTIHI